MCKIITNQIDRKRNSACLSMVGCGGALPPAGAAHAVMALADRLLMFIYANCVCGCTGGPARAAAGFESPARFAARWVSRWRVKYCS